jgi:predicted transposase YbfD/YdcC
LHERRQGQLLNGHLHQHARFSGREKEKNKGKSSTWWHDYSRCHPSDASEFNRKVRTAHGSIENNCHWVLDMRFREHDCRIPTGTGAEHFAFRAASRYT